MSNLPGLHVIGEANFSDHGANRLGASALMQGLADGYFILPYTLGDYLATAKLPKVSDDHPQLQRCLDAAQAQVQKLLAIKGTRTVDSFHRELGMLMWNKCGMARNAKGLKELLVEIPKVRKEFWRDVNVPGSHANLNMALEKAGRVADFLELAELMALDALDRDESCGGHFREERQTPDGEALRNDAEYCHVRVWEHQAGKSPLRHKEPLTFANVQLATRSYK